jgi:hypothetical protein
MMEDVHAKLNADCHCKSRIEQVEGSFHKQNGLKSKEETRRVVRLTWTLGKVDQKYLGSFEMYWRGREKISWTDPVSNEEALRIFKEERNTLHTIKRSNANWIVLILPRNCPQNHVIGGKIEGRREVT